MLDNSEMIMRLALGALYGGIIGFERQVHGRPAGFRTNILVCMASVLLMEVSEYYQHLGTHDPAYVRVDPGRIAAGAITGIGFIGAGVIIKLGANVLGLTTAASLWMVAAIGLAVGAGFYVPSFTAFLITLAVLLLFRYIERLAPSTIFKTLVVHAARGLSEESLVDTLKKHSASLYRTDYDIDKGSEVSVLRYTISIRRRADTSEPLRLLAEDVASIEHVQRVELRT